jgi:predicted nucleic acid-binding protein
MALGRERPTCCYLVHHSRHAQVFGWLPNKQLVLCPLAELGFLRISSNRKAMAIPMEKARQALQTFKNDRKADWIADDLPGLGSKADISEQVTDNYLAELAAKHGHKLATLDEGITHHSADLIA